MGVQASTEFIKPKYDEGGFASLPDRISTSLLSGNYDSVTFILVDSLGWRFIERFQDAPFLRWVQREGTVEKITSQFPSTTAAHLTTLHTGKPVGEHGIYEWNYYDPEHDLVISPLLFSHAGTYTRDTLREAGIRPRSIYPAKTIYSRLAQQGIQASILQHREYTPSTYSNAMTRGAQVWGYKTLPEAMADLGGYLESAKRGSYFHLYFDKVDAVCHDHGPGSSQTEAEVEALLMVLERHFTRHIRPAGRALFILSADHGQVEVDPAKTVYLNLDERFSSLRKMLRCTRQGQPIVAAGSCRDFFLYINEGKIEEARDFLASRLEGKAEVWDTRVMAAEGWFGPKVSAAFRRRLGDLVILPYAGEAVWWYEKNRFFQRYHGHHGGLTPQEMEIPLIMWQM